jgi:hypothetical protein
MPYKHIKVYRKRVKHQLVMAKGGECQICGYNRCIEALDFHHIDPSHKDFNIARWDHVANKTKMIEEAKKCVLLCSNCHREVHQNIASIDDIPYVFDESKITSFVPKVKMTPCEFCGKEKAARKNSATKSAQMRPGLKLTGAILT